MTVFGGSCGGSRRTPVAGSGGAGCGITSTGRACAVPKPLGETGRSSGVLLYSADATTAPDDRRCRPRLGRRGRLQLNIGARSVHAYEPDEFGDRIDEQFHGGSGHGQHAHARDDTSRAEHEHVHDVIGVGLFDRVVCPGLI